MAKRVVITGATGLIGRALSHELIEHGYEVVVFTRDLEAAQVKVPGVVMYVAWQPEASGDWGIAAAMARASVKPQVYVGASSVGAFGYTSFTDAEFDERSPAGDDFWGRNSAAWEAATLEAEPLGARTVVMRTGYVLDGGPHGDLQTQAEQFRRGFGGPVLPGKQWLPWIHLADEVGLFLLALEDERARGPLNAVAPGVVRQREFAATLSRVVGKPSRFPIPGFALRLGVGVVADIVVLGRRVIPRQAQELGYTYRFPALAGAMRDLLG